MLIDLSYLIEKYHVEAKGVIHLGGHFGQEADAYHKHGLKVIWVEAIESVFKQLKRNVVKYAGTVCLHACVSDRDGDIVDFNISNNEGQSSSLFEFGTHTECHPGIVFTEKTRLQTLRVDTLLKSRHIDPEEYDFLNLDLQGAELLALKGTNLSFVRYIYIEVNERELYKGIPLLPEIDDYLKQHGFERVETNMTHWGWGDAFYIKAQNRNTTAVRVPEQFRPKHPFPYPGDNEMDFERWYYENYTGVEGRVYLPIMWTAYYCKADRVASARPGQIASLQKFLNTLDQSKKYFTIVQYDDGILNDLSHLDIKVFSMSGKPMDYCLPLLCQDHKFTYNGKKDIFCSFMGRNTHPIRSEILKIKQPGWMITDKVQKLPEFCTVLARSIFTLCPRGYGPTSFRIRESIQCGSIPVYVSDVFIEGHGVPFEEYGVKISADKIAKIPEILNAISSSEIEEKQQKLPYIFSTYFSYEGNKKIIDKIASQW